MSKWDVTFGVSDIGQDEQIDSTKKAASVFGGEAKVSTSGLNAQVMKKKPKIVVGGGTADGEDDPMGMIPTAQANPSQFKEVEIKGGQFPDQPTTCEMGTDYQPPQPKNQAQDDQHTNNMLKMLEQELMRGKSSGGSSNAMETMLQQISQTSKNMIEGRKEILAQADKKREKGEKGEPLTWEQKNEKRKRNEERRAKAKEKKQTYSDTRVNNPVKTQEEMSALKHNQQFEDYYKGLGLLSEEEWPQFYQKLKEPLDVCFRINSIDKHSQRTLNLLNSKIDGMLKDEETKGRAPTKVKWYPNQMAYCFDDLGRVEMRRAPAFKDFHRFIVTETENGRIFRQEKVSMIPVTLLQIEPHHKVLDMCAAPGSKTIQILEYLHKDGQMNTGYCVANDTDMKRAYMLTHQARRLNSPSLFVINNDARFLPNLRINEAQNNLKFDRILCDVPCSGDGTFRKNNGLWNNFHNHMGHVNHPLQLEILERGFKMLKLGGRIVYSTCTFNPIENEAVVAAALARHIKQMKIVDVSKEISPDLKYRPGLTSWKVFHRGKGKHHGNKWYKTFNEITEVDAQHNEWRKKVVKESMFTSTYTDFNNDEDRGADAPHADPLNLKHCMRFYPHDDNQGGFFVCVMEKILDEDEGLIYDDDYKMDAWSNPKVRQKDIIEDLHDFVSDFERALKIQEEETGEKADEEELVKMKELIDEAYQKRKKEREESKGTLNEQILDQKAEEEAKQFPYAKLLDFKPELWSQLTEFYGIDDTKFPVDQVAFQQDTHKNIYLLNPGLTELLSYRRKNKLNVVNIGLKIFTRNRDSSQAADYRLVQEGLGVLLPFMSDKRKIHVDPSLYKCFTEIHDHMLTFEALKTDWKMPEFESKEVGSAVMCFDEFAVAVWIGKNNVSLMISKEEINSIRFLMDVHKNA